MYIKKMMTVIILYMTHVVMIHQSIELFPKAVQETNIDGYYPLHLACIFGQCDTVLMKLLELCPTAASIKFGHDDCMDSVPYGYALHLACSNIPSESVIRKLIELNPSALQETRNDGDYPIHCAFIGDQSLEVIKLILDTETLAMKRKNKSHRETPLHIACQYNRNVVTVEYMIRHLNFIINEGGGNGGTPLHRACHWVADKIVEKLLQHPDILVNAKDGCNQTALQAVLSSNHYFSQRSVPIVNMLLNRPFICLIQTNHQRRFSWNRCRSPLNIIEERIMNLEYDSENADNTEDFEYIDSELQSAIEIRNLLKEFPFKRRCDSYSYFVSEFVKDI